MVNTGVCEYWSNQFSFVWRTLYLTTSRLISYVFPLVMTDSFSLTDSTVIFPLHTDRKGFLKSKIQSHVLDVLWWRHLNWRKPVTLLFFHEFNTLIWFPSLANPFFNSLHIDKPCKSLTDLTELDFSHQAFFTRNPTKVRKRKPATAMMPVSHWGSARSLVWAWAETQTHKGWRSSKLSVNLKDSYFSIAAKISH